MSDDQQQHKRARGDVPSLDDEPTPEDAAVTRHNEPISLISANHTAINSVGTAVENLTQKVEALDVKVNKLEKRVDSVQGQNEEQSTTMDNLIKANGALMERMVALERKNDALERKLDVETAKREALETNGRQINLEISGIPKVDNEDCKALVGKVMTLVGSHSPLGLIDVAHRKMNGEMIVKFRAKEERNEFYERRFELQGKTSKDLGFTESKLLFINENLTVDRGQLLHDVRNYMKPLNVGKGKDDAFKIKTVRGIVKVMNKYRNYIAIHSMNELVVMHPN